MRNARDLNSVTIGLMVALAGLVNVGASAGEWEDEFPVVQDPVDQRASRIAIGPDDAVYVLWPDWTIWDDTKVMLTRSTDKGQTWTDPAIVFDGSRYENIELAADEAGLHLALAAYPPGGGEEHKELYYARSEDGGATFSPLTQVGTRREIQSVRLMTSPGKLFIYARDYSDGGGETYLYVSTDGGDTWVEKLMLPEADLDHPSFAVEDGVIHVVFGGFLFTPEMMYSQSTDDGETWSTPAAVSLGSGSHSQLPTVAVYGGVIHAAWEDDRDGYFNVFYSYSTDGGVSWSRDRRMNDTYYGARTKLLADREGIHLVWCQYHGPGWPSSWGSDDYGIIWYRFSEDGFTWTGEQRVSQNEAIPPLDYPDLGANYVRLAGYRTGFCAMWQDKRDGNIDIYMRNNLGVPCEGDADGDGDTDLGDLATLLAAYGTSVGDPGYSAAVDFDESGTVDLSDLAFLLADYGCGQ